MLLTDWRTIGLGYEVAAVGRSEPEGSRGAARRQNVMFSVT